MNLLGVWNWRQLHLTWSHRASDTRVPGFPVFLVSPHLSPALEQANHHSWLSPCAAVPSGGEHPYSASCIYWFRVHCGGPPPLSAHRFPRYHILSMQRDIYRFCCCLLCVALLRVVVCCKLSRLLGCCACLCCLCVCRKKFN